MRAIFVAAPVILFLGVYQAARGEPANVSGGLSCPENGIGAFRIQIVGEIDSTTVDKVSRLFDELHEVDANGGVAIRPRPGRPSGPSVLQRRFGEVPQWGKSGGNSVKCPVFGVGYEINSPGGSVSAAIAIGRMFRRERNHLQVNENSVCISACVLILAGAVERPVSGVVGIHRPYLGTTPQQQMTTSEVTDRYKSMLQDIRLYLREMNVSERLADDMLATDPERVHILTEAELKSYGLADVDPVEQQRRAIEKEALDIQEANKLGLDRREYTRRKALGISSCVYNSSTGNLMRQGEMLDCRRRILTTGR
jgi:ATP-dependent protease ClpP protease subunit